MKSFTKRSLAVLIAVLMVFSVMAIGITSSSAAAAGDKLYLVPNSNWTQSNARFAAYFFNNSVSKNTWVGMTAVEGEKNLYEVTIPDGTWPNVIFCRMNPSTTADNWNNKWNQTSDLTIPTDTKNCYSVKNNTWDNGGGTWSVYAPVAPDETTAPTEAPKTVYTVAGSPELCGTEWNPEDTNNNMTDNGDGTYTKVYTDVPAGTYQFKIVEDNSWSNPNYGVNGGQDNITVVVNNKATITITFDSATCVPSFVKEGDEADKPVEPTTVYFVNSGEWAEVCAHMWGGAETVWPGVAATKVEGVQDPNGFDVYSVTFTEVYTNVIFNNNNNGAQTGNDAAAIQAGKYLNFADQTWYASLDEIPVVTPTEPEAKTYTVAGSEELCGAGWDPADTNNDMTDEDGDGVFTKVYEEVAAGTYEFKVVANHAWGEEYGNAEGGNLTFTVNTSATVTITFDTNTNTVAFTVEGDTEVEDPSSEAPVAKTYTVAGSEELCGTGWDPADTNNDMTDEDGDGVFTKVYEEVAAGTYEFKVVANHAWGEEYGNADGSNVSFTVNTSATVTITFDTNTNVLAYELEGDTTLPETEPQPKVYTLIGYINGANVGCEDDYMSVVDAYTFVDGKVVTTFEEDSYVAVKTTDNANWYWAETYTTEKTVNLYQGNYSEKMFVPGGVEVEFTLVENEDGSVTLSYVAEEAPSEDTTASEESSSSEPTPVETKTVKVGVIEYITNFVPTVHYWNDSMSGDAELTATGETANYAVGENYWGNEAQSFVIYTAEVPVTATGMKTFNAGSNDAWANEEVNPADDEIILVFEYDNAYHNVVAKADATVEPTEPSQPESSEPAPSEPVEVEYVNVYFQNNWLWNNVKVYYYESKAGSVEWPGMDMNFYKNDGIYDVFVASVPSDAKGLVFNNGEGTQSPDVTDYAEGNCYYMIWDSNENTAKVGVSNINDVFPTEPESSEPESSEPESSEPEASEPESSEPESSEPESSEPESSEPESSEPESSEPESSEPESSETVKNGIVEEDGALYYYVDGVKTYAGLIKIDGAYYYVNSSCKVIAGKAYYVSKTNLLLPSASYTFDETGKMVNPPAVEPDDEVEGVKNGLIREDGALVYYVDDVKTYGGLIKIGEDYYYVNSSCKAIVGKAYYVSKTNNYMERGSYTFGADGKMVK